MSDGEQLNDSAPASSTAADPRQRTLLTIVIDQPAPGVVVVRVGRELDMSSAPDLDRVLRSRLSGSPPRGLVLDLTELTFLGSHGIALLVELHDRTIEEERTYALRLVGIRAMFDVHDTVGSALLSLR